MRITATPLVAIIVALAIVPTRVQANSGDFDGGVAIGASYAGVDTAPTNGLIVQGAVAIGTPTQSGSYALTVSGTSYASTSAVSPYFNATTTTAGYELNGNNGLSAPESTSIVVGPTGATSETGANATSLGYDALNANTTGASNTAIGASAGSSVTTGSNNVVIGASAGSSITTGGSNVVIGSNVSSSGLTTGIYNILIGVDSTTKTYTTSTDNGIAIGQGVIVGSFDIGIGYQALNSTAGNAQDNIAIGFQALKADTTGDQNTALGVNALTGNTTGAGNVAIGNATLQSNLTGKENVAVGVAAIAGVSNDSTQADTAVGAYSLNSITTGQNNTAVGHAAGYSLTTGSNDVFVGYAVGDTSSGVLSGNNDVLIGASSSCIPSSTSTSDEIDLCTSSSYVERITGGSTPSTSVTTLAGNLVVSGLATDAGKATHTVCELSGELYFGSGTGGICAGTSSLRYKARVSDLTVGLAKVMQERPITYYSTVKGDDPDKPLYGLSAEHEYTVLPTLVGLDGQGRPNSVDYLGHIPVLINAIKEQQAEIEELKHTIEQLKHHE